MKKLPRLRTRYLAANVGIAENTAIAVAAHNSRALTGEEWEQITPWGNFPNPKGLQRLTITQGNAMVAAFNSVVAKAKNLFRGVPIYIGHPDVDPERWPDERRIGKLEGLEARADGLYGKVAWNDIGEKNKDQGYWVYPSGVWKFKKCPGGVIEPFELLSVGMTNTPNITGVQPWAKNSRAANAGTSAGALKGWATRRAGGAVGGKNPVAVKVKATMAAKKAGRKPTKDDKAKAAEALDKKTPKQISQAAARKIRKITGKPVDSGLLHSDIVAAKRPNESHQDAADRFVKAAQENPGKVNAVGVVRGPMGLHRVEDAPKAPAPSGEKLKVTLPKPPKIVQGDVAPEDKDEGTKPPPIPHVLKDYNYQKGRTPGDRARAESAVRPPPIPAAPRSVSSGGGTHVHVHVAPAGAASSDNDPYFGYTGNAKTFRGAISRRVAMRLQREKSTAAA